MPFKVIGGMRESLMLSSEDYKLKVQDYLKELGFILDSDSYIHGSSPDLIYVNHHLNPDMKFHVEVKATKISLMDKDFAIQYLKRLTAYLNASQENRFTQFIIAQEVANQMKWKIFFDEFFIREDILSWVDTYKELLADQHKSIINNADQSEILKFFENTEVTVALGKNLDAAIDEIRRRAFLTPSKKANLLHKECFRREFPIKKQTEIKTNLVEIRIKEKLYRAYTHIKQRDEIYAICKGIWYPPFILINDNIYCLYPFDENNPLTQFIEGDIVEDNLTEFSQTSIEERNDCSYLLREYIKRLIWQKGIYRVPNTSFYYFPAFKNDVGKFDKVLIDKLADRLGRDKKEVVTPYYYSEIKKMKNEDIEEFGKEEVLNDGDKEDKSDEIEPYSDKDLFCLFHRGAEIRIKHYWDKYYVQILPRKFFSKDGSKMLWGSRHRYYEEKFRNPLYNRNSHVKANVNFFISHLFENEKNYRTIEPQFANITYKRLILPFDYLSRARDPNKPLMEEYFTNR